MTKEEAYEEKILSSTENVLKEYVLFHMAQLEEPALRAKLRQKVDKMNKEQLIKYLIG